MFFFCSVLCSNKAYSGAIKLELGKHVLQLRFFNLYSVFIVVERLSEERGVYKYVRKHWAFPRKNKIKAKRYIYYAVHIINIASGFDFFFVEKVNVFSDIYETYIRMEIIVGKISSFAKLERFKKSKMTVS